jgi:hypothetical protein
MNWLFCHIGAILFLEITTAAEFTLINDSIYGTCFYMTSIYMRDLMFGG